MHKGLFLLPLLLFFDSEPGAQEDQGLMGTWTALISYDSQVEGCGRYVGVAELHVQRRVEGSLDEIYRGAATGWNMGERCGDVDKASSGATIRVKRGEVNVSYAEARWSDDTLVLDGDTMTGTDAAGAELRFTRVAELPFEERASLARENMMLEMPEDRRQAAMQVLTRIGMDEDDAERIMNEVFAGVSQCIVDAVRTTALRNGVAVDKAIDLFDPATNATADRSIMSSLDPREITIRQRACFHDIDENVNVPRFW